MTVKPCNQLAVGATDLDRRNLSTFFHSLWGVFSLVWFP